MCAQQIWRLCIARNFSSVARSLTITPPNVTNSVSSVSP